MTQPDIADLLLAAYDAGYSHAAGIPLESPQSPLLRQLLTTVAMRHQTEVLALRAWADPPLRRQIPPWLAALAAQADAVGMEMAIHDHLSAPPAASETAPLGNGTSDPRWP